MKSPDTSAIFALLVGLAVAVAGAGAVFGPVPCRAADLSESSVAAPLQHGARSLRWLVQVPQARRGFESRFAELLGEIGAAGTRPVTFDIEFTVNSLAHWNRVRVPPDYHVVLDAAHFAMYRAHRFGFVPRLTMGPGISYRLVTRGARPIVRREDLRGLRIAARPAPGLAALRLLSLFQAHETSPDFVAVSSEADAVAWLQAGRVQGALVSSGVGAALGSGRARPETVMVLDEVPGPVLSTDPALDAGIVAVLRHALVTAGEAGWRVPARTAALAEAGILPFVDFDPRNYQALGRLLRTTWGYQEEASVANVATDR